MTRVTQSPTDGVNVQVLKLQITIAFFIREQLWCIKEKVVHCDQLSSHHIEGYPSKIRKILGESKGQSKTASLVSPDRDTDPEFRAALSF